MKGLLVVAALFAGGCFPLPLWYRDGFDGFVVDELNRPVAGAAVIVCSTDGWSGGPPARCPRRANTRSDDAGRFHIPKYRDWVWSWWFPQEPARPTTFMAACAELHGQPMATPFHRIDTRARGDKRVSLAPSGDGVLPAACVLARGR